MIDSTVSISREAYGCTDADVSHILETLNYVIILKIIAVRSSLRSKSVAGACHALDSYPVGILIRGLVAKRRSFQTLPTGN